MKSLIIKINPLTAILFKNYLIFINKSVFKINIYNIIIINIIITDKISLHNFLITILKAVTINKK